jgi:hypothetical protein
VLGSDIVEKEFIMKNKEFSERLNQELDNMDLPQQTEERVDTFAKLIKIPRFQASIILNGQIPTDTFLLQKIADELEVSVEWLLGKEE